MQFCRVQTIYNVCRENNDYHDVPHDASGYSIKHIKSQLDSANGDTVGSYVYLSEDRFSMLIASASCGIYEIIMLHNDEHTASFSDEYYFSDKYYFLQADEFSKKTGIPIEKLRGTIVTNTDKRIFIDPRYLVWTNTKISDICDKRISNSEHVVMENENDMPFGGAVLRLYALETMDNDNVIEVHPIDKVVGHRSYVTLYLNNMRDIDRYENSYISKINESTDMSLKEILSLNPSDQSDFRYGLVIINRDLVRRIIATMKLSRKPVKLKIMDFKEGVIEANYCEEVDKYDDPGVIMRPIPSSLLGVNMDMQSELGGVNKSECLFVDVDRGIYFSADVTDVYRDICKGDLERREEMLSKIMNMKASLDIITLNRGKIASNTKLFHQITSVEKELKFLEDYCTNKENKESEDDNE